jgi:predicted patatin/cPLA2 family phospholipase
VAGPAGGARRDSGAASGPGGAGHPTPLPIVATDVRSGQAAQLSSRDESIDLLAALKASAAVPVLYHRTVAVNGSRYVDGGLVDPVPIERALADGCTDILVVLTVSKSYRERPPNPLTRRVACRRLRRLGDGLAVTFVAARRR